MRIIYLFILLLITFVTTPHFVLAGGVGIGATEVTQGFNNLELIASNASENVTAIATNMTNGKLVIADPIANGLIAAAQQQVSDSIIRWAQGGFNGQPTIISDPQKFIEDQATAEAKKVLDNIPKDSLYGDSIFSTVLDKYKVSDLKTELAQINSSNIPSLLQKKLCNDASLTTYAKEALSSSTYTDAELAAKKRELFNYACNGDPTKDKAVAARLNDLNKQRPEIGGWDAWLATTGGDNAYTARVNTESLAAKRMEERKQNTSNEIYQGAGPVSQKKCIEDDSNGNCLRYAVTTPGDQISAALSKANTAALDRLSAITGTGALTTALVTGISVRLQRGLNEAVVSIGQSGSNNSSVTISATTPPKQDLNNDNTKKKSLVSPMLKQLQYYNTSLENLKSLDQSFLADLNSYGSRVSTGKACYESLVADGILAEGSSQLTDARAFYANRQGRIDRYKNSITPELAKIASAQALVNKTISQINASNSTEEISSIFNEYSEAVEAGDYPTYQNEATRKGEYQTSKSEADRDTDIKKYQDSCNQMRSFQGFGNQSTGG